MGILIIKIMVIRIVIIIGRIIGKIVGVWMVKNNRKVILVMARFLKIRRMVVIIVVVK